MIECDSVPIWFSWTNQIKSYAFPVNPEKAYHFTLRTGNKIITLRTDAGFFQPGKKTLLSINSTYEAYKNKNYSWDIVPAYRYLDKETIAYYQQYIAEIPVQANHYYTYLKQGETEIPVQAGKSNSKKYIQVGPIIPGMLNYNGYIDYEHEGGYRYDYKEKYIYKRATSDVVPRYFYETQLSYPYEAIHDVYISPDSIRTLKVEKKEVKNYSSTTRFVISQDDMDVVLALQPQQNNHVQKVIVIHKSDSTTTEPSSSGKLAGGLYEFIILYENGKYIHQDSVNLSACHYHFIPLVKHELQEPDTYSQAWAEYIFEEPGRHPESPFYIYIENNSPRQMAPQKPSVTLQKQKRKRTEIEYYREIIKTHRPDRTASYTFPADPPYTYGLQETYARVVSGIVYDESDEPLIGANIAVAGTNIGCVTDIDGKFPLSIPATLFGSNLVRLVISYIGYESQEIIIQEQGHTTLRIVLKEETNSLSEMVVIGYGINSSGSYSAPKEKKEKR